MKSIILIVSCLLPSLLSAQVSIANKNCAGLWKTVDDESGRTKSHVRIYEKDGKFFGKIDELVDPQSLEDSGVETYEEIMCDECPAGHGKDLPIQGLTIIWDMQTDSDKWADGQIMDPENGKIYGCTLWLDEDDKEGNTLKVRGWLAFFYRTQTWYRVE